ncbi:hypothetical protein [Polaromonas hydrogenivorans]|uniref:NodB homology domain-containing protein n=1 Tax=Polaromonas hydrogenivorans TaxID=335476 RepID=A0AAU7LQP7_9BURK
MQKIPCSRFRSLSAHGLRLCFLMVLLAASLSGCIERSACIDAGADRPWFCKPIAPPALEGGADPGLLLLLVPEGQSLAHAQVTAWMDAASEEGLRMQAVTDRQFLALGADALKYAGLVLPDQLHAIASNELVQALRDYTTAGGNTMLVYDFGIFTLNSQQKPIYAIPTSRLSDLAGVDYALYDDLREKITVVGPVTAMRSTMRQLQVPPGKSIAYVPDDRVPGDAAPVLAYRPESALPLPPGGMLRSAAAPVDVLDTYSGYLLGNLDYSSFVTGGAFNGKTLATSPQAGLVAGLNKLGRGQVLFVNLPLTYLKVVRTDAQPMHGFLHYFGYNVLQLAHLSSVPQGIPGLTLNWHLDSFTAQQPTLTLEKLGVFDEGPFSIDMTAGPDAVTIGDGKGWNLDSNKVAQDILWRFARKGHAIGSHGGWNHDYYGLNASDSNQGTFLPYLEKNLESIRRAVSHPLRPYLGLNTPMPPATPPALLPAAHKLEALADGHLGQMVRQYSPPVGNNPTWAMDYLERQGVVGVYFAGHTGLGPTRQYRDGQLLNPGIWVFPVTPAGKYATFEEFQTNKVPRQEVIDWYRDLVDFTISQRTTRMIYMHPNGANVWPDVLQNLLAYAKSKGQENFRWYTMPRLADFMTARREVQWTERRETIGVSEFEASHPGSLNEMVWLLPKTRYAYPPVSADGSATVSDRGTHWAVRAGNTRQVKFTARLTLDGTY